MSIFKIQSFDRKQVRWEEHLNELTPVEFWSGMWFKREDLFAPLGSGRINGAKLRQLIWLVWECIQRNPRAKGVISGSVAGSPQSPMVAAVAKHFGLSCSIITGAKDILKHSNLVQAYGYGAQIENAGVGYAPALESKVFQKQAQDYYRDWFPLETNITVTPKRRNEGDVRAFHYVPVAQVQNIPSNVERLIIPCGSANSTVGVLTGLIDHRPERLKEIWLMGIGNVGSSDLSYIYDRLEIVQKGSSKLFSLPNKPNAGAAYNIFHADLQTSGYCRYEDLMHTSIPLGNGEDLHFHPRYEGKVISYIRDFMPELWHERSLFWIIGSEPK